MFVNPAYNLIFGGTGATPTATSVAFTYPVDQGGSNENEPFFPTWAVSPFGASAHANIYFDGNLVGTGLSGTVEIDMPPHNENDPSHTLEIVLTSNNSISQLIIIFSQPL